MHLILTGATGLVGSSVLDAMLKTADITKISILSRRPIPMAEDAKDPRVRVIIHKDFEVYEPELLAQLKDAEGCVWALGTSATKVTKEQYVKLTKDYAVAAAKAFSTLEQSPSPTTSTTTKTTHPFRFIFVSGEGTTQTPGFFTPFFGLIKGETESLLGQLSAKSPSALSAYNVRPAFVDSLNHEAIKKYIPTHTVSGVIARVGLAVLAPPIRHVLPSRHSPTEPLGRFLVDVAMGRVDDRKLEGAGAERENGGWVVSNVVMRGVMGL